MKIYVVKDNSTSASCNDLSLKIDRCNAIFKFGFSLRNESEKNVFLDGCKLLNLGAFTLEQKPKTLLRSGNTLLVN